MEIAMKEEKMGKWDKWEIENLADKFIDVEECKKDKEKMKYVKKCLDEKMKSSKKAIQSIKDIKEAADSMPDEYEE